jgi:hypothetical protein
MWFFILWYTLDDNDGLVSICYFRNYLWFKYSILSKDNSHNILYQKTRFAVSSFFLHHGMLQAIHFTTFCFSR